MNVIVTFSTADNSQMLVGVRGFLASEKGVSVKLVLVYNMSERSGKCVFYSKTICHIRKFPQSYIMHIVF